MDRHHCASTFLGDRSGAECPDRFIARTANRTPISALDCDENDDDHDGFGDELLQQRHPLMRRASSTSSSSARRSPNSSGLQTLAQAAYSRSLKNALQIADGDVLDFQHRHQQHPHQIGGRCGSGNSNSPSPAAARFQHNNNSMVSDASNNSTYPREHSYEHRQRQQQQHEQLDGDDGTRTPPHQILDFNNHGAAASITNSPFSGHRLLPPLVRHNSSGSINGLSPSPPFRSEQQQQHYESAGMRAPSSMPHTPISALDASHGGAAALLLLNGLSPGRDLPSVVSAAMQQQHQQQYQQQQHGVFRNDTSSRTSPVGSPSGMGHSAPMPSVHRDPFQQSASVGWHNSHHSHSTAHNMYRSNSAGSNMNSRSITTSGTSPIGSLPHSPLFSREIFHHHHHHHYTGAGDAQSSLMAGGAGSGAGVGGGVIMHSRPFRILEAAGLPSEIDSSPIAWAPDHDALVVSLSKQVFLWTPKVVVAAPPPAEPEEEDNNNKSSSSSSGISNAEREQEEDVGWASTPVQQALFFPPAQQQQTHAHPPMLPFSVTQQQQEQEQSHSDVSPEDVDRFPVEEAAAASMLRMQSGHDEAVEEDEEAAADGINESPSKHHVASGHETTRADQEQKQQQQQQLSRPAALTVHQSVIEPLFEGRFGDEVCCCASGYDIGCAADEMKQQQSETSNGGDGDDGVGSGGLGVGANNSGAWICALGKTDGLILLLKLRRRREADNAIVTLPQQQQRQQQQQLVSRSSASSILFFGANNSTSSSSSNNNNNNNNISDTAVFDDREQDHLMSTPPRAMMAAAAAAVSSTGGGSSPFMPLLSNNNGGGVATPQYPLAPSTSSAGAIIGPSRCSPLPSTSRWIETSRRVLSIHSPNSRIVALKISEHYMYSASNDGLIFCTNLDTLQTHFSVELDGVDVVDLCVSPSRNFVAIGTMAQGIVVVPAYNVEEGTMQLEPHMRGCPGTAMAWSSSAASSSSGGGGGNNAPLLIHAGGVCGDELVVSSISAASKSATCVFRLQCTHPIVRVHCVLNAAAASSALAASASLSSPPSLRVLMLPGLQSPEREMQEAMRAEREATEAAFGAFPAATSTTATASASFKNPNMALVELVFAPPQATNSSSSAPSFSLALRGAKHCQASHSVPPIHSIYSERCGVLVTGGADASLRLWQAGGSNTMVEYFEQEKKTDGDDDENSKMSRAAVSAGSSAATPGRGTPVIAGTPSRRLSATPRRYAAGSGLR